MFSCMSKTIWHLLFSRLRLTKIIDIQMYLRPEKETILFSMSVEKGAQVLALKNSKQEIRNPIWGETVL